MTPYETFWQAIAAELDLSDDEAKAMANRLISKGISTWEQWLAAGEVIA